MDDLLKHLNGGELSNGETVLAWALGIAAGIVLAVLLLAALV